MIPFFRKYWILTLIIFCSLGASIGWYYNYKLEKNFITTSGVIKKIISTPKGGDHLVSYNFSVLGRNYSGNSIIPGSQPHSLSDFNFIKGETLLVMYQRDNPGNSRMLFLKEQYKRYRISLPKEFQYTIDSLGLIISK